MINMNNAADVLKEIKQILVLEEPFKYENKEFDWRLLPGDAAYKLGVEQGRSDLATQILIKMDTQ